MEQLHSSVSHMDELRQELSHHKQSLVDKDEVIHQLELSLSDERDKVSVSYIHVHISTLLHLKVRVIHSSFQRNFSLITSISLTNICHNNPMFITSSCNWCRMASTCRAKSILVSAPRITRKDKECKKQIFARKDKNHIKKDTMCSYFSYFSC